MFNVKCEKCGQEFEMSVTDADERQQAGVSYLCPKCEKDAAVAAAEAEPRRRSCGWRGCGYIE